MLPSRRHQNQRPGGLRTWWRLGAHSRWPCCIVLGRRCVHQLRRDGPGCSALLGKGMAGDFCKALLIWRDPAWAGGQLWDLAASCTRAGRMLAGFSDAHPRGAHCSPSTHVPLCGKTQGGIPEPPSSPSAPGLMLFHNVFWETIAGF